MRHVITAMDVRCPSCGALPGARCRSPQRPSKEVAAHEPRRRRAREEQARINPEHVHGQLELIPRRAARP
jgi:hypothetical protein